MKVDIPPADPMAGLTEKERRFVEAMHGEARWSATKAARIAGYKWPGKVAWQVVRRKRVKALVEAKLQEQLDAIRSRWPHARNQR